MNDGGTMGGYESCSHEIVVGNVPLSYFVVGLVEVIFCLALLASVSNRLLCRLWQPWAVLVSYMLPIYISSVVFLILAMLFVGVMSLFGALTDNRYFAMAKWFVIRSLSESLSVFLLHPGIGVASARRSLLMGTLWTAATFAVIVLLYLTLGFKLLIVGACVALLLLIVLYFTVLLAPSKLLPRRPALNSFALLTACSLAFQLLCLLVYAGSQSSAAACTVEISLETMEFLQIVFILLAFALDSRFWQGLYSDRAGGLNQPLLGIWDMDRTLVNVVTSSVIQLERKVVTIIPFSALRLDTSSFFSGGTARVYKGSYQDQQVAIKFLFCIELTPERIVAFCDEATMLNSLQHESIVRCHGVAIMPPALSLVTEFCANGSLFDFLHAQLSGRSKQRILFHGEGIDSHSHSHDNSHGSLVQGGSRPSTEAEASGGRWWSSWLWPWSRPSNPSAPATLAAASADDSSQLAADLDESVYRMMEEEEGAHRRSLVRASPLLSTKKRMLPEDAPTVSALHTPSRSSADGPRRSSVETNSSSVATSSSHRHLHPSTGLSQRAQLSKVSMGKHSSSMRLKSPSSIMLTREMGFGLGPLRGDRRSASYSNSAAGRWEEGGGGGSDRSKSSLLLITGGSRQRAFPSAFDFTADSALVSLSLAAAAHAPLGELSGGDQEHAAALSNAMVCAWLPVRLRVSMMRDCCAGLAHLHSKGFIHCDIKSLNFLGKPSNAIYCLFCC